MGSDVVVDKNATRETWENVTKGKIFVIKFDKRGNVKHEPVRPGGKIHVTPEERQVNQERAADESLDFFKNGKLVAVKLIDGTEDLQELASNPNTKSESDLRDMLKGHWKTFEKEVAEISNVITLRRLREIALEGDATVRQLGVIDARIEEVSPKKSFDVENEAQLATPTY